MSIRHAIVLFLAPIGLSGQGLFAQAPHDIQPAHNLKASDQLRAFDHVKTDDANFSDLTATTNIASKQSDPETVILLHGLARSDASMAKMAKTLQQQGYRVCNIDYPSTQYNIETLAQQFVLPAIKNCTQHSQGKVHFVTHSMGGILVRYLALHQLYPITGQVVMLGPPNHGSEIVNKIGKWKVFYWVNGQAGQQLRSSSEALPQQLGKANFKVGVIAGDRSINWINSMMIKGKDDGKVSLESAKLDGMQDYIVLHTTHPMMMNNVQVQQQTLQFLRYGKFLHQNH